MFRTSFFHKMTQDSPRWLKMCSRCSQDCLPHPRDHVERTFHVPGTDVEQPFHMPGRPLRWLKMAQDALGTRPMAPKQLNLRKRKPKASRKYTQEGSRWPRMGAKWRQDEPRWRQDGPRYSQDGPRRGQDRPQDGAKMGQEGPRIGSRSLL